MRSCSDELLAVLDQADADDAVRVLIVTGAGRAFSRGRRSLGRAPHLRPGGARDAARPPAARTEDGGGRVTLRIFDMRKTLIAVHQRPRGGLRHHHGRCPWTFALASTAARIGFVFRAAAEWSPEACSTWFLPRLVGPSQAAEWVYTGACSRPRRRSRAGS